MRFFSLFDQFAIVVSCSYVVVICYFICKVLEMKNYG